MTKRLFVLGNSHLRSLNNNKLITPIFLGSATKISLLDTSINRLYTQIQKFFELKILRKDDNIYLFFGEGAIRYSLNNNYYPHKIGIKNYNTAYKSLYDIKTNKIIEKAIKNYIDLYKYMLKKHSNIFIISCVTAFFPIINKVKYFNNIIEKSCKNFIDIFTHTLVSNKYSIKPKYLNFNFKKETKIVFYKNYDYDPIHLGNTVSILFINKIDINEVIEFVCSDWKRDLKYNCYIIKL